jgi:20S proteasome subunit beta 6
MAAMFSGAPPQGGPGYSFKQTPTAVPSGERQHGFYPYDSHITLSHV